MTNWNLEPNKNSLRDSLNAKYGKRFSMNLRNECLEDFRSVLADFMPQMGKVVLIGVNNFEEVDLLPPFNFLAGVDLADNAFHELKTNKKNILPIVANAEILPFSDDFFDEYLAFRSIFSSHTDLRKSLSEADRVTHKEGKIVASVPNGYLTNGEVVKGMFNYLTQEYDIEKPYKLAEEVKLFFLNRGYEVIIKEIESEVIILVQK